MTFREQAMLAIVSAGGFEVGPDDPQPIIVARAVVSFAQTLATAACEGFGHDWNSHATDGIAPDRSGTFCERCGLAVSPQKID